MGNKYQQLTIEERCEIARLRTAGHSQRQIAASLDRAPSTVARELKRNSSRTRGYQPSYAQQQARARRWSGSRLERDASLRQQVLAGLTQAWSPEQAAGRQVSSHESSYRFIYAQLARKKEYSWRRYLPRAKFKRGYRGRRGGSPASFIAQRRPLSQRPQDAADRRSPGHWEADLMLFRTYGQVVLTLHERHSRLLIARRAPGKAADPIAQAMAFHPGPPPAPVAPVCHLRQRRRVRQASPTPCPGHPDLLLRCPLPLAERGVENAIGRIRRFLPRKTDLAALTQERFCQLVQACNNTPRQCLGYNTPAEVFSNQVLPFNCESTSLLSQERRGVGAGV